MPSWGEILAELNASAPANNGQPDFDGVRRRYLKALNRLTGRDVIIYYADWLGGGAQDPLNVSIHYGDMQGLMEVFRDLRAPGLDLFLHSPGGSAEAAARMLDYLRSKYDDIRVVVPLAAMSAATMLALGSDRILMGKHSQLGPIDPQVSTPTGQYAPAAAILEQFDRAQSECQADPSRLGAWLPILQQYGVALLQICEAQQRLGRRMVSRWLREYMLRGQPAASRKASAIARYFGDYGRHKSHSLAITRTDARSRGVVIENLEDDPALQDAILSVHHATMLTLNGSAVKIIENHLGRAFVINQAQAVFQLPLPQIAPAPAPPSSP